MAHMQSTPRKHITIQDIADEANVSISTVSRVLNGNVPVRESKRLAVQQAIDHLEYRPNVFAQSLASGQSMTIGVLTQQISSPLYDAIVRGALSTLRGTGYSPIITDGHWQADKEKKEITSLLTRQVDGLILVGPVGDTAELEEIGKQVPLVIIGRTEPSLVCLSMDNWSGGYAATKHLIELGHRQIAHITGLLSHDDAVERLAGYRHALREAGLPSDDALIVEGQFSEQSGVLALEMLLTRGRSFSALFAANDQMAFGARLALHRRGIRVPDDVSVVGYDDQPTSAYMIPPLTTMRQHADVIGRTASEKILQLLKNETVTGQVFSAELVIRDSTVRYR